MEEVLIEKGTVVEKVGKIVKIAVPRKAECERCDSLLCNKSPGEKVFLEIECDEQLHVGDSVEIQIFGKQLVKISFLLYFIPLVILVLGNILLLQLINSVILAFLISLLLIAAFYFTIWKTNLVRTKPIINKIQSSSEIKDYFTR